MPRQITDREKLMLVAGAMGQKVNDAQATTGVYYDKITSSAADVTLFEGCNSRAYPQTNLGTNKLPYKNNLVIDFIQFNGVLESGGLPQDWLNSRRVFNQAYFTLTIGSQDVLKQIPMSGLNISDSQQPWAGDFESVTFVPWTKLVIPADTTFKVKVENLNTWEFPGIAQRSQFFLKCTLKGYATIKGGTTY
jgi:hypothetical protein